MTLVTRRRAALPRDLVEGPATLTPQQFAGQYGTDPADLSLITSVLAGHGLRITGADAGARRVTVRGTVAALSATFGATLRLVRSPGPVAGQAMVEHRYREGGLQIPAELDGIVLAVLGLDDRPQARAHFRHAPAATARADAPAPAQPGGAAPAPGRGFHVLHPSAGGRAISVPGGHGRDRPDDRDHRARRRVQQQRPRSLLRGAGRPPPPVTAAGVDGAVNQPGQDPGGADGEVLLDIEVAGSVAPGAAQVVYFAPKHRPGLRVRGDHRGARHPHAHRGQHQLGPVGGPLHLPRPWTALDQALADAAALGVTVCAAAGEGRGRRSDGQSGTHVDFPASSPHALACGGTSLRGNAGTGVISSETVWNDGASGGATGGGA